MNVYCVLWGDKYSQDHVFRLRDQVAEHLPIPHNFRCITDQELWGVDTLTPFEDWPGWWSKLNLFHPLMPLGLSMFLDLDVAIVDDLTPLVKFAAGEIFATSQALCIPANWAASGHGGCQSSVMLWNPCRELREIWRRFESKNAYWPPAIQAGTFWGDQEYITSLRDAGIIDVVHTPPEMVVSYKYHVRPTGDVPDGAQVVVFHGDPKPWQVGGFE